MGFLDGLFDDDNTLLIVLVVVGVIMFFSKDDGCGFGGINLGDNWLLIVVLILCLCGDGLNIF
ncbi:MAG: hypothetical protein ACOWWH_09840 [Eubacteriaceae bacterium]